MKRFWPFVVLLLMGSFLRAQGYGVPDSTNAPRDTIVLNNPEKVIQRKDSTVLKIQGFPARNMQVMVWMKNGGKIMDKVSFGLSHPVGEIIREFHENGIMKSETIVERNRNLTHIREWDENGKIRVYAVNLVFEQ